MRSMDQWIGEVDKKFTEKELKQLLGMEFRNVLSYMKLPQEWGDSKGIEEVLEVSSTVRSRKLTLSYRCLQWPRTKELSKIPSSWVRSNEIEIPSSSTMFVDHISKNCTMSRKIQNDLEHLRQNINAGVLRSILQTNPVAGTILLYLQSSNPLHTISLYIFY